MTKHFILSVSVCAAIAAISLSGCGTGGGDCKKAGTCDTGSGGGTGGGGTGGSGGTGGTGGTGGAGGAGGAGGGGGGVVCNANTCSGCCTPAGCVPLQNTTVIQCGINGSACVACPGDQSCTVGACGGGSGGSGGAGGSGGSGGGGGTFVFDGGVFPACVPRDGGTATCTTECQRGFRCVGGQCVLNGSNGPLQVTLRWNTQEDLDLHLDEPLPDGGSCEIWYGDVNDVDGGNPSQCGAVGALDLDSEAACPSPPDFVDIENIIYPAGSVAPSGTYNVRVDHYLSCDANLQAVPFQLEVRQGGNMIGVCGVFFPADADFSAGGAEGGGRPVFSFTVP
jgi:hypothetical protein